MRGSPGEGEWFLMRFWRTVVGVVFGVLIGIVVTSPLTWIPVLKNALNPDFIPNRVSPVMGYIVQNWSLASRLGYRFLDHHPDAHSRWSRRTVAGYARSEKVGEPRTPRG